MANETTITSTTEIVNSEWINPMIMDYAADVLVAAPHVNWIDLAGKATKVAAFPRWEKDTGEDITTEGTTSLSNVEITLTEVQVTAAQVGIKRELTEFQLATNILGEAGMQDFIARDGGYLLGEMIEDDICAVFTGFNSSVGATGVDASIANLVQVIAKARTDKMRGQLVGVIDDQQQLDLTAAIASTSAQLFSGGSNQTLMNSRSDGYLGEFLGMPIWYTNLTDTQNTGEDVCGGFWISAQSNAKQCAIGGVSVWTPRMATDVDIALVTRKYAMTAAYGVGEVGDGIKLVTDA